MVCKSSLLTAFTVLLLTSTTSASKFEHFKQYLHNTLATARSWEGTEEPVIGVVTQTLEKEMETDPRFADYKYYIMQSYVDWLQAAGARVVPLIQGDLQNVTMDKLSKVNAVLFPGGDGDYLEFGREVFTQVKGINDNGGFLPLWGTCMGYENMVSYVADEGWDVLSVYDLDSASLAVEFVIDPQSTKMYQWLGAEAMLFEDHNVTYNSHHWSMNPDKFKTDKNLSAMFTLTGISYMPQPDGRPIVASIESEHYPFFGTQFHPEKPTRIFKEDQAVNHSWVSIQLNQHFGQYFVYQARHNNQTYGNYSEVQGAIIQNHELIVTDEWYDSVYVFK